MNVLVTGANGYVGSHVIAELERRSCDVIAVDISESNLVNEVTFIQASILDDIEIILEQLDSINVCIDLAWRNGFVHNSDTHIQDLWGHYHFISSLIDAGLKHFVGMGTMHEIGYWEGSVNENTPCNPISKYGISKNALRELIQEKTKDTDVVFQWVRGYYLLGDDSKNHSIFAKLLQAEASGMKTFPFNSGENQYDFIDIDELAKQIVSVAMQSEVTGIINCCSGKPTPLKVKVESYIKNHGMSIKLDYGKYPDRPYDSPAIWGDPKKINYIIGKENNS